MQTEKSVETNTPTIRTIVQDLGEQVLTGIEQPDHLRLIIPERLKGREFKMKQDIKLTLSQSALVNKLYNEIDILRGQNLESVQSKLLELVFANNDSLMTTLGKSSIYASIAVTIVCRTH